MSYFENPARWNGADMRLVLEAWICHPEGTSARSGNEERTCGMGFCEHCEGQRFDRAQVLRQLRQTRLRLRDEVASCTADEALELAIRSVRALEIPHLEPIDDFLEETAEDHVIH